MLVRLQAELVYTYASHVPYPSAGFVRQQTEAQHAEAPEAGAQHTPRIAPAPGCAAACPPVQAVCEGAAGAAVCLQKSQGPGVGQLAKALSLPSLTTAIVQPAKQWLKGAGVAMHAGELVIYAGHKGFVRMAIEQQVGMVCWVHGSLCASSRNVFDGVITLIITHLAASDPALISFNVCWGCIVTSC